LITKVEVEFLEIGIIDKYLSLIGIIKPKNYIKYGSLTYTTVPNNSSKRIPLNFERQVAKNII
jgi:hypothetical protein